MGQSIGCCRKNDVFKKRKAGAPRIPPGRFPVENKAHAGSFFLKFIRLDEPVFARFSNPLLLFFSVARKTVSPFKQK